MKTIGLIGGMSWESTSIYYRLINEAVKAELGGLHSAKIVLFSVDFEEVCEFTNTDQWRSVGSLLAEAARRLEAAGADLLVICTNTMHKVSSEVQAAVRIPLLHIADATAEEIKRQGVRSVGLIGTTYTMEETFYRGRLENMHRISVVIPDRSDRIVLNGIIYDELCLGIVRKESRRQLLAIIDRMREAGAEAVIEGCTEITMLIAQEDTQVPLFDTTLIHARHAARMALAA